MEDYLEQLALAINGGLEQIEHLTQLIITQHDNEHLYKVRKAFIIESKRVMEWACNELR